MPHFQHTFILSCGGSWYDILLFYFIYFDLLASHSFVKETYIIYYLFKKQSDVTNSWVKLTLENRLVMGGCPRTYKHMIKLTLNQCETLES